MRLFFSSLNDSLTLLSFRLKAAHPLHKIIGLLFVTFSLIAITGALHVNELIRTIMNAKLVDNPSAETTLKMKEFIGTYLQMYATGNMDSFVSISIALLLGSIVLVPFSGYVIHGVVSHSEMVIVKNGDNYKIGDSIMFQVISSFTLVQLLGLTVVSQLLTFDSELGGYATVFVWSIWVLVTLLTSFLSWVVEYVARRYGRQMRILFLGLFVIGIAALFTFDPNHGTTLFGSSRVVYDFLQALATGNLTLLAASLTVVAGLCVLFIYLLTAVASEALKLPEPIAVSKTNEKQIKSLSTKPLTPLRLLAQLLFRYAAITKPVMTSLTFSLILVVLLGGIGGLSSVMIVLPLAVSISFGANIFGLVSGSMNWLLTIEGWRKKMFTAGSALIALWIVGIYALVVGVGFVTNSITVADIQKMLPSFIVTTATTTTLSIWLSVKYPLPFSGKARENLVSSPIRLMVYVGLLLGVTGTAANATYYSEGWYSWTLCGLITMISICCYYIVQRKWNNTEDYTQKILKETINAG
jgi:hypothetical protein